MVILPNEHESPDFHFLCFSFLLHFKYTINLWFYHLREETGKAMNHVRQGFFLPFEISFAKFDIHSVHMVVFGKSTTKTKASVKWIFCPPS